MVLGKVKLLSFLDICFHNRSILIVARLVLLEFGLLLHCTFLSALVSLVLVLDGLINLLKNIGNAHLCCSHVLFVAKLGYNVLDDGGRGGALDIAPDGLHILQQPHYHLFGLIHHLFGRDRCCLQVLRLLLFRCIVRLTELCLGRIVRHYPGRFFVNKELTLMYTHLSN